MSIRVRLMIICLLVALLPAIPLSFLVRTLIDRSFDVGLSETVSRALDSGVEVSRKYLDESRRSFENDVYTFLRDPAKKDSGLGLFLEGIIVLDTDVSKEDFTDSRPVKDLLSEKTVSARSIAGDKVGGEANIIFYESEDRSLQLAFWSNPGGDPLLFYGRSDETYISETERIIEGSQTFARLRLEQGRLGRSFFYPFIVIYSISLILALLLAYLLGERLTGPIRRLEKAVAAVGAGDWTTRVREKTGGETGRLIVGFNDMVSRLGKQRQRLTDMEKMASWREVARHLAHEIKNPILPIRLTVQEMKDQYSGSDTEYSGFLNESARLVEGELNSLQKLVKEFSAFARMPGLSLEEGSLVELASEVASLYPSLEVRVETGDDLPRSIFDHDQVRRVFVNLFDNTIAVAPEDRKIRVSLKFALGPGAIEISFTDNGPGIPEDDLTRIFDPYFTTREEGTGLGLAMVKNVILQHGGQIRADNSPAGGAIFTMIFPHNNIPPGTLSERPSRSS